MKHITTVSCFCCVFIFLFLWFCFCMYSVLLLFSTRNKTKQTGLGYRVQGLGSRWDNCGTLLCSRCHATQQLSELQVQHFPNIPHIFLILYVGLMHYMQEFMYYMQELLYYMQELLYYIQDFCIIFRIIVLNLGLLYSIQIYCIIFMVIVLYLDLLYFIQDDCIIFSFLYYIQDSFIIFRISVQQQDFCILVGCLYTCRLMCG